MSTTGGAQGDVQLSADILTPPRVPAQVVDAASPEVRGGAPRALGYEGSALPHAACLVNFGQRKTDNLKKRCKSISNTGKHFQFKRGNRAATQKTSLASTSSASTKPHTTTPFTNLGVSRTLSSGHVKFSRPSSPRAITSSTHSLSPTQLPGAGGRRCLPGRAPPCSLVEANQLQPASQDAIGTPAAGLAEALATAKQITWRGQSELPQMPWPQARQGLVLVIDLWSGIGGLLIALLALGVRCIAVSAESQGNLWPAVQKHFPHLVHVDSVEALKGEAFLPVLKRRQFSAVLIGGGRLVKATAASTSTAEVCKTYAPNNHNTFIVL